MLSLLARSSKSGSGWRGALELLAGNPETKARLAGVTISDALAGLTGRALGSAFGGGSGASTPKDGKPPLIESEKMADDRLDRATALLRQQMQLLKQADAAREESARRQEQLSDELSLKELENAQRVAAEERALINETVLAELSGAERVEEQLRQDHEQRLARIRELDSENGDSYNTLVQLENQRHAAAMRNAEREKQAQVESIADFSQIIRRFKTEFAGGLASVLVDGIEEGEFKFKEFFHSLLKEMAKAILAATIFRTLWGASGGGGLLGGFFGGGGQATALAGGGVVKAADGINGVGEVSKPTFFPKFNVLAGEAGREVLTVLARPRMVNIGDFSAQVGEAGLGRCLAITSAESFTRAASGGGGARGGVDIRVHLAQGLKAEIVKSSVESAVVTVTQEMGRDSRLSRTTRKLTA